MLKKVSHLYAFTESINSLKEDLWVFIFVFTELHFLFLQFIHKWSNIGRAFPILRSILQLSVSLLFLFSHTAVSLLIHFTCNHIRLISVFYGPLCFAYLLEQIVTIAFSGKMLYNQANLSFTIQMIVKLCNLHETLFACVTCQQFPATGEQYLKKKKFKSLYILYLLIHLCVCACIFYIKNINFTLLKMLIYLAT